MLKEIEKTNATKLFEKRIRGGEMVGIVITLPTANEIGIMGTALQPIVDQAPPDRQDEVYSVLQAVYNSFTAFRGKYRVVFATLMDGADEPSVMVSDYDDLALAIPNENGSLGRGGVGLTIYRLEPGLEDFGWRGRYDHILLWEDNKWQ